MELENSYSRNDISKLSSMSMNKYELSTSNHTYQNLREKSSGSNVLENNDGIGSRIYKTILKEGVVRNRANQASSLKIKDNDTNVALCCSCDAKRVASYYCKDCSSEDQAEYLCSTCVEAHKTVRLTRNHDIYDSSLYSTLKRLFEGSFSCESCEKNKTALYYCQDCSSPDSPEYLCSHCVEAHKRVRVTRNHVLYDSSLYATINKKK